MYVCMYVWMDGCMYAYSLRAFEPSNLLFQTTNSPPQKPFSEAYLHQENTSHFMISPHRFIDLEMGYLMIGIFKEGHRKWACYDVTTEWGESINARFACMHTNMHACIGIHCIDFGRLFKHVLRHLLPTFMNDETLSPL
jgi:hypothetical protein